MLRTKQLFKLKKLKIPFQILEFSTQKLNLAAVNTRFNCQIRPLRIAKTILYNKEHNTLLPGDILSHYIYDIIDDAS
jgi:hypothetical protein